MNFLTRVLRVGTFAIIASLLSPLGAGIVFAAGTNIVPNPTLDVPSSDPTLPANWHQGGWGTNQATFTYPATGPDGSNAAAISIASYTNGDAKWYFDPVAVTAGDSYAFSDSYKSDVPTIVTIEYGMSNGSLQFADVATLPSTGGSSWTQSTSTFTVPTGATALTVFHLLNRAGSLTIDNVSLTQTVTPPPPPPPQDPNNLVPNAALDGISPTDPTLPANWHQGGWGTNQATFTYPATGPDGSNAAAISIASYTNGDAKWYFDPVAVTAGDSYAFSDSYKSDVPTIVTIEYGMSNGSLQFADVATLPSTGGSSWTQSTSTFTVPSGATTLTVFHLLNRAGSLTIDNVSLDHVTTPPPPPPPPPQDPKNIIPNAALSVAAVGDPTSPLSWHKGGWGTNQTTFTYPVAGFNSTSTGIQIQIASYTNGDAKWYFDPVAVSSTANYQYTDYYKSDVPTVVTAQYSMSDGTFTYADIAFPGVAADWTPVTAVFNVPAGATGVTVFHLINQVGTLTTSAFSLKLVPSQALSQGMVTLSFDDGYQSVYDNAKPILDAAGYKATMFIITGPDGLNNQPDYMTTAEVLNLNNSGYEIGSHTQTHPHLPTLTAAQLVSEIQGSKSDLLNIGIKATTFAYPYGEYDSQVVQAVKDAGYVGARSVNEGFNDKSADPFLLMDQHVESTVTPAQIETWIDQALANKQWLILEMHDQNATGDQYSNSPATLQAVVDYLKQRNVKVVTVAQGLQIIKQ